LFLFKRDCVKSYAETNVSNCKYEFVCLEGKCEGEFSLHVLQDALDSNLFSTLVRNKQNEEIKKANIPNLESCQFCNYAEIIDNPDEKVFKCRNPECLKERCR
jgi:TRIAD3 protein (E3 ubiquitin-protein ligase RNF216)